MNIRLARRAGVIASTFAVVSIVVGAASTAFAAPTLTITPLTWGVIGLDSNNVNVGPAEYPVGARVCNTSATENADNVTANFVWDTANANINLKTGENVTVVRTSLAPTKCYDFYWLVAITRTTAAYNTTRRFRITANATNAPTLISTPSPRELYVEKIVSQNRNSVLSYAGPTNVFVGQTVTYTVNSSTATNGYEQIESFLNMSNVLFRTIGITRTYTAGTTPETDMYGDACGWVADPTSGSYRSCTGTGKQGGAITTQYTVQLLSSGSTSLAEAIYDFSGSSYHYNSDFGAALHIVAIDNPTPNLLLKKRCSPNPVVPGGTLTCVLSYANNSTSTTYTGVEIQETYDNRTTFLSASPSPDNVANNHWTIGTLAPGQYGNITIQLQVASTGLSDGQQLTNTAYIRDAVNAANDTAGDPAGAFRLVTENTKVAVNSAGTALLRVTKTPSPALQVGKGSRITYTITYQNLGPATAYSPTLTDTLYSNLTFVSASPSPTTSVGQVQTWSLPNLAAGASGTITVVADVASSVATGTFVSNAVDLVGNTGAGTVSSQGLTARDYACVNVQEPSVNLGLTKTEATDPTTPGSNIVYTLTVANTGNDTAHNATVVDVLDANTSYVSASGATCVQSPTNTLTCNVGTIYAGGSTSFTITALVGSGAPTAGTQQNDPCTGTSATDVCNNASVTATETDSDTSNNSDDEPTNIVPSADMAVTKTGPGSVTAGTNVTYTITVTNNGPSTATAVTVDDPTPSGLTFVSNSGNCVTAYPCSLGSIASGASRTITTVYSVPANYSGSNPISNTATVSTTATDTVSSNNSSTATTPVVFSADMAVTKTGPASIVPGQNAVFTVTVTNNGSSDAANVTVADPTPSGLTFVSNSGSCTTAYPCSLGTVPAGATRTITTTFSVPSTYTTPNPLLNTATVSTTTTDPVSSNNSSTSSTPAVPSADVAVTKTGPATFTPSGNITYTVTITNNGPSQATGVSVADTTPSGLTFVSNTGDCTTAYPCSIGTLAVGATRTITTTFSVPSSFTTSPLTNTATVSATTADPVSGNNTSTASTTITPSADLAIVKTAPATIVPGQNAVYTIVVTNNGTSDATGVTVADTTPTGMTFVSNTGHCTSAYPCSLGTVPAGATRTITTTFSVPASYTTPNPALNTATVSASTTDPTPGNNSSTTSTPVVPSADLSVVKIGPGAVTPGTTLNYSITVTNNGPSNAANVVVADPTPAGLTFVSNTGGCVTAYPCSLGTVAAGATVVINTTFSVPLGYTTPDPITNTATVSTTTNDPVSANNSSTETTAISFVSADMTLVKTGPASATPGQNVVYTLTITNLGPNTGTNTTVVDPTPAGLTFVSNSGDCTTAFPCSLGSVPLLGVRTITTTYAVPASYSSATIVNNATVTSDEADPVPGNNPSTATTPVTPIADLVVTKTGPASAVPGQNVAYTVTVTNNGPSDAAAVTVSDTTPSGLTFVSNAGDCATAYPCSLGTIAAGATKTITTTFSVPASYTTPNPIQNTASASTTTTESSLLNNSSTASTPVVPSADVQVVKTAPASIVPGQNSVWTITVTNNGPSDAQAVSVADTTPSGLTFVSNAGSCTTAYPCSLGTVPAGATRTITTTYSVPSSYTTPDPVPNTATVSSTTSDPTPGNNTSTATSPVVPSADMAVVKTAPATVVPGQNVVYTLTLTNNGPSDAANVTVADPTPTGLTFVSNGGDCTTAFPCSLGTVASGATRTITATYSVPASYTSPDPVVNVATVATTTTDPVSANNSSTTSTPVAPSADVAVTKTGPASATPGSDLVYTITVTNNGPSNAAAVSVADPTPAGLTFSSNAGDCVTSYPCALGTLAPGATRTITTTYAVPSSYTSPNPIVNTATVSTTTTDPVPGNNSDTENTPATPSADLELVKTAPATIVPGQDAVYTITVTNNGLSDAANVSVADPTPTGMTFVSNAGDCTTSYPCTLGTVPAGATRTITTTFSVPSTYTTPAPAVNTATVSTTTTDPDPSNDSDTTTTPVVPTADVGVTKGGTLTVTPAGNVVYTVTVTNNGPSVATAVSVADPTPTGLTFVSNAGSCTTAYPCSLGTLAVGATRTITSTYSVPASYTSPDPIVNTATVSTTATDPDSSNDSDTHFTSVDPSADLSIDKVAPAEIVPGQNAVYTVTVTNAGPSDAAMVLVSDPTPAGFTFVSNSGDCTSSWPCNLGTLPAGATRTITTTFAVDSSYTTPNPAVNTATVSSTTSDPVPGNNTDNASAPVSPSADLSIVKVGPGGVTTGSNLVYTLLITNNGSSDATSVTVTDPTPAGLTFVSNSGDCATAFPCSLGTVPAGASRTITSTFSVPVSYTTPDPIVNTATVSSPVPDPVPGNNSDSESTALTSTVADLAVTKTGTASVAPGGNVVYTVTVTNNGPATATGVEVTDPTPSGLTFVSNAGNCTTAYPCSLGTLASGASRTITTTYSVPASYSGSNPISNTAVVSGNEADLDSSNNSATATTTVSPSADLRLDKSGPATFRAGGTVTYTIAVTNDGPSDAAGVSVVDTAPTGFVFVSNTGACGSSFPCSLGTVPAGATRTITSTYSVPSSYAGANPAVNTATVSATTADPDSSDNSDSHSVSAVGSISGTVFEDLDADGVYDDLDEDGIETVTVTITGPSCPAPAGCTVQTDEFGEYRFDDLILGTYTIVETDPAGYTSTTPNSVTTSVGLAEVVVDFGDILAPVASTKVDLKMTKAHTGVFETCGSGIYVLRVNNIGTADSSGLVTVTDVLPNGLTFVSATGTGWTCSASGQAVTCQSAAVIVAGSTSTSITLTVNIGEAAFPTVNNTASVSNTGDANTANNSASDGATVRQGDGCGETDPEVCDISLRKSHSGNAVPGGELEYSLQWSNSCRGTLTDVEVSDPLPAGLTLVSASSPDATATISGNSVVFRMATMAGGDVATATIRATVAATVADGTTITNIATVEDADGHTDVASDPARVRAETDTCSVSLRKVHSGNDNPGGEIQYTLQWSNACREDLTDVDIVDPVPAGVQVLSARSSYATATITGNTVTFHMDSWPKGTVANGSITARIAADTAPGTGIRNVATLTDGAGHTAEGTDFFRVRGESTDDEKLSCFVRAQVYARPGRYVKYEVRYKNGSLNNDITLTIPDDVEIDHVFPAPTSQDGNTLTWTGLAATSGKVTVNTLVSLTAEDQKVLTSSAVMTDGADESTVCEHVGVVNRYEKLFTSIKAQSYARPGSPIRYTARYREAVGTNQMIITLPNEVTIVKALPAPTGGSDKTLVWDNLPVPSGVVKIDAIVSPTVANGTTLAASELMTDATTDVVAAEALTLVTDATSGGGSVGDPGLTLSATRSVTPGTTTNLTIRYEGLVAPGAVFVQLPPELTPVLSVPSAQLAADSALWDGLTSSSGTLKLRVAVATDAAAGKTLALSAASRDANGAVQETTASTVVRADSTSGGGTTTPTLTTSLTLARSVTKGLTTDISADYEGLSGSGQYVLTLPPQMKLQSTVPAGAQVSGNQVIWSNLTEATGSLRARVLVSPSSTSGSTLAVSGDVTDSTGAAASSAGTTTVR